ncbi:hypothetical protein LINGRAHAP2_LOCUS36265 [Linum grandiflorum]
MELSTLCGVTVCVVAAGRDGKVAPLWPEGPENVKKAIESYKTAEKKIETTVLGYLDEGEKKMQKSKFRALKKKLGNWIDWLQEDDEGLKNAVGFCASKIEELEGRIRVSGPGGAEEDIEDKKRKRVVIVDEEIEGFGGGGAQAQDRKRKRVMTSSSMANVDINTENSLFDNFGNGALMGDPLSSLLHGYGDEFGAPGSSDPYLGIPIGNEALSSSADNSLFGCYGGAGDTFGLYETMPCPVWNPQQQTGFGSDFQPGF